MTPERIAQLEQMLERGTIRKGHIWEMLDVIKQRKPLTDEELYKVFPAIAAYHEANKTLYRSIARAVEAAHGIKGEA